MQTLEKDVCIVGAGPAGIATAISLAKLGHQSVLIDRCSFPRDKICGDAISTFAFDVLNELDNSIVKSLSQAKELIVFEGIKLFTGSEDPLVVNFSARRKNKKHGWVVKRFDFDNHLFEFAKQNPLIEIRDNTRIQKVERQEDALWLYTAKPTYVVKTKLLVVAEGSSSHLTSMLTKRKNRKKGEAFAMRQYFSNVPFNSPFLEFYFLPESLPGYVWLFPLEGNKCNVGIYLQRDVVKEKGINLRRLFNEVIQNNTLLKNRLKNAVALEDLKGCNLNIGPLNGPVSGDNFLLVGDAAGLVDPLTGEGIGNALSSGMIAAKVIDACKKTNSFDSRCLKKYDQHISDSMQRKMKTNRYIERALKNKLCSRLAISALSNKWVRDIICNLDVSRNYLNI